MFESARRIVLAIGLSIALTAASVAAPAMAQPRYFTTESKYAAIVMDAKTGEVLYSKNADSPRYPASITKIMTLYLAFEALSTGRLRLNDLVVVSPHAASMAPTKLGLRPGETITVDDAMRAIAVKSANDMAVALAEKIGGSESRFAALMTLRAQELGMTETHYVNACGLPDTRQITSARDIAILSRAVMRDYPQYYSYFGLRQFTFRGQTIKNHNGLLGKSPGVDGLKTGYINASGFNLAASAVRNNQRLITVVLGGNSTAARDEQVEDLMDAGFDVLHRRQLGDHVTVAQDFSDPDPIGEITRPSTEQGSGDQAGVKIELTGARAAADAPAPTADHRVAGQLALAKADIPAHSTARRDSGRYLVQIGAYKSRRDARKALDKASRRFNALNDSRAEVQGAGRGYYRARFSGMSDAAARQACHELSAHGQSCQVMEAD